MSFFEHICHKNILASSTTFSPLVQESDVSSRRLQSFSNVSNEDNKGLPESQGKCLLEKIETRQNQSVNQSIKHKQIKATWQKQGLCRKIKT